MDRQSSKARASLVLSMMVFGTIGIFRRYLPVSSGLLAMSRGYIGGLFLIFLLVIRRQKPDWHAIRRNLVLLLLSGCFIGINWIFLFESYQYTSVATATLCYYMAPVFLMLVSPFLFREKLTRKKLLCVPFSLFGVVLISGVFDKAGSGVGDLKGIFYGLGAAVFYTSVICLNKQIRGIHPYDKTIIQLLSAATVLIPYNLLSGNVFSGPPEPTVLLLLLVVGIVHTGFTYALYFGSLEHLPSQTVALFSYIDPVCAILLSALFLGEQIGLSGIAGSVLILGSALFNELSGAK